MSRTFRKKGLDSTIKIKFKHSPVAQIRLAELESDFYQPRTRHSSKTYPHYTSSWMDIKKAKEKWNIK